MTTKWTENGRKAAMAVSDFTLTVARPLYWHPGAQYVGELHGGTAFILRFDDRYVGITADHVVEAYLQEKTADARIVCQLGDMAFDLGSRLISRSSRLDIATFDVADTQIKTLGDRFFDCRGYWPPPDVKEGDTLTLTGFLDTQRVKDGPQCYTMNAWGAHGLADGVSERDLVTIYDPARDQQGDPSIAKPALGMNLSGCSGGPTILIKDVNGLLRWFPVGLIYKGPDGKAEGEFASFDRIHVRRIHFVGTDGTIHEPEQGWLP